MTWHIACLQRWMNGKARLVSGRVLSVTKVLLLLHDYRMAKIENASLAADTPSPVKLVLSLGWNNLLRPTGRQQCLILVSVQLGTQTTVVNTIFIYFFAFSLSVSVEALASAFIPVAVDDQADDYEEDATQHGEERGEENGYSAHPFFGLVSRWKRGRQFGSWRMGRR